MPPFRDGKCELALSTKKFGIQIDEAKMFKGGKLAENSGGW